jgi:hypothetical protein
MRSRWIGAVVCSAFAVLASSARPEARGDRDGARANVDAAAMRELLEGTAGRRETWKSAPSLVIVTSVMNYSGGDLATGFVATDETLLADEVARLAADLTESLKQLTGGVMKTFRTIVVESAEPGRIVKTMRAGQIVIGRFRGVKAKTGNLGYGGRMTRNGTINGATVILDAEFDRGSDQRALLRTHELGHALGYHHVESRPSVMNPRVGNSITDFDRAAIRVVSLQPVLLY